ncbi:bifunctional alpha/beta hydrolase/OsmC family protein [Roseospira goensis]|uniref:Putative redox protein n=1 Tax=Roseospira goensis TaxID=391922 RepID=A0A7W6S052_9PROT|nr:bifunctional alpha/beta hydrolase/OsmC family protein [Roseospira goensis]MBB4286446.1 putative redox protein [Roseospira goensis]
MTTHSEKITFPGAHGHPLAARLDAPTGAVKGYALFAHCFTCSKDIFAASRIAGALAERGIAVLRFDFTGLGASEGEFANTTFSSNIQDLIAAADWLRETRRAPALLIGHSLGGAAVLAAAPRIPEATAVVTIGAPSGVSHVTHHFADALEEIRVKGMAEVTLAGRPFTISRQFVEDTEEHDLLDTVAGLRTALLLFHAPRDQTVGIDNASRIFQAAKHPKSFVSLDDADHLLTRKADAVYVADVIAAWASRYVADGSGDETHTLDDAVDPGTVLVTEAGDGPFAQTVRVGRHVLRGDEPVDVGGRDSGPTPYDFLLAALGTCTAMTIRLYADRKKIALDGVGVSLSHRKVHARDCGDCEATDAKIDEIARTLELRGDLDADTRARLLEIADRCPVHRTLNGEVRVRTRLRGEDA